ncbi:MAG: hypothetical protein PVH03_07955, partial [Chloroflexota bacterium]
MKSLIFRPYTLPFFLGMLLFVIGCRTQGPVGQEEPSQPVDEVPSSTTRVLPTIYPTNTAVPPATPTDTRIPVPTEVPNTPVAFDQVAVDIRYFIPGLALDRRIQGNVANQIEVVDETTGESVIRRDQPGVLLELQQALSEVELSEVPEDCDYCVQMEYELPLADISESGWLDDPRLLASLENYTAVLLGPHFPEGTVVGLRRGASPLHAAHTIGLTEDGQLYFWTAVDPEVPAPQPAGQAFSDINEELADLDTVSFAESYTASCDEGFSQETLTIRGEDGDVEISITCPAHALPTSLTPIYQTLDELVVDVMGDDLLERPAMALPLDSLVFYRRDDGFRLNLFSDETAVTINLEGQAYTGTVTSTLMLSMTTSLIESDSLILGVESIEEGSENSILFVRGEEGVYEG